MSFIISLLIFLGCCCCGPYGLILGPMAFGAVFTPISSLTGCMLLVFDMVCVAFIVLITCNAFWGSEPDYVMFVSFLGSLVTVALGSAFLLGDLIGLALHAHFTLGSHESPDILIGVAVWMCALSLCARAFCQRRPQEANRTPFLLAPNPGEIYESFVAQSESVCRDLLECGQLEHEDVRAQDPVVLLGVTKVVILRALLRSRGSGGVVLVNGTTVVNDKDLITGIRWPGNERKLFEDFKSAREALEGVNEEADENTQWMEDFLLHGADRAGEAVGWKNIVCSKIYCMSLEVLRLQAYSERKQKWRLMYERLGQALKRSFSSSRGGAR